MARFAIGDTISLCASLSNFCGASNFYYLNDINASSGSCTINTGTDNGCLPLNGVNIEFQWANAGSSSEKKTCTAATNLKLLGSAVTDSLGVASLSHVITQEDHDLYAANSTLFDLRACIRNGNVQPLDFSDVRSSFQISDPAISIVSENAAYYIEYDLSLFPAEFLSLISSNITYLANSIGSYLPLAANITYVTSTFDIQSGKFRLYFNYTAAQIQTVSVTLSDMISVAAYVTGILILVIVLALGLMSPYLAVFGIALSTILLWYKLVKIQGPETTGTGPATAADKVNAVNDYITNYLMPQTDSAYSGCVANPPTCNANTMRSYLAIISQARVAQCQKAKADAGLPVTECDAYKTIAQEVDTCLANGSCTPQQAKSRIMTEIVTPVQSTITTILEKVTCPADQVYDPATQTCILKEGECWIPSPIGGCILSAKTGKTIAIVGGLVAAGIVIYKISK